MSLVVPLLLLVARAPGVPVPESVLGEVVAVRAEEIDLRTDAGGSVALVTDGKTVVLRSRPGARSLSGAAVMPLSEIARGDRVLARGTYSPDRATFVAVRLVVMKQAEIEAQREQERSEWRRRGLAGVVLALNAPAREISVRLRGAANGQQPVLVSATRRDLVFRRYAPNSVKFSDARPSSFEELAVGDQVRMLGDRSADGAGFEPEQIVSGAFRTLRGAVASVDVEQGELGVRTVSGGEPSSVTVRVGPDARLHRLPADAPQRVDLDEMLERLPRISLGEVGIGEEIAVLGPKSDDGSRLTAMKLVAGLPAPVSQNGDRRGEHGGPEGTETGEGPVLGLGGELPW